MADASPTQEKAAAQADTTSAPQGNQIQPSENSRGLSTTSDDDKHNRDSPPLYLSSGKSSSGSYHGVRRVSGGEEKDEDQIEDGGEVELPEDAYGAAMFALIYDSPHVFGTNNNESATEVEVSAKQLNRYRLAYVMAVLIINYIFQFMMLYWVSDFVVQPAVHKAQYIYATYHGRFFSMDGDFEHHVWDDADAEWDILYKKELCHMVFSKFYFLWVILMLWLIIMVIEFRSNAKLLLDVFKVPSCPGTHPELMLRNIGGGLEDEDAKLLVVGLTPGVRIFIVVVILIPKFIIGFWLTIMGMCWLTVTDSFSDLILNSLALEFVICIDDHLFEALLPESYRDDMKNVVLHIPEKQLNEEEKVREDWLDWRSSSLYFIFFVGFSFTYLKYLQILPLVGVLPFFRHDLADACEPFLAEHKKRFCLGGLHAQACFPYGHDHTEM